MRRLDKSNFLRTLKQTCVCLVLTATFASAADAHSTTYQLDIPAQSLSDALQALALASQHKLLYDTVLVKGKSSTALKGEFTAEEAVKRLLSGTNLSYEVTEDGLMLIRMLGEDQGAGKMDQPASKKTDQEIDEIVVTGTHLGGVTQSVSPVQVYSREDIDRTGISTIAQFVQTLPQNFNGGASETTIGYVTGEGNTSNSTGASGINLRGLGNDSTMVLLNGHRLAPSGFRGNFVDVSMIPLSALERLEVVTDGASAIYGSDAVGGVANFILRKRYSGLETRARVGAVSKGDTHEIQAGQTAGFGWQSGSALLNYEYYDRTRLDAADRSFSEDAQQPFSLLPIQVRHNVLLAVDQSINPNLSLFAQALYGHRSMAQEAGDFATRQRMSGKESNYSGTFGADARVSDGGSLAVSGSFATSDTDSTTINEGQVLPALEFTTKTAMYSADVVFRDSLWESAAGKVRYALGGQYRNESYDYRNPSSAEPRFNPDRNVSAAFAELRIPMWASGRPDGLPRIELSLADRQEHYSDFGSTNNPSGGLIWRALPGLAARATVGKSFKAPLFYDTNPGLTFAGGLALADPVAGDGSCAPFGVGTNCTNTLVIFGGNPDLKPERATTWTAGLDWTPQSMPNLKWSATYYNIHYKDRIAYFSDSISTFSAYAFESILGPILSRDPSAEIVQRYTSLPNYLNLLPGGGPVEVFLDGRSHNLSVLDTDGIDTDFNYSLPSSQGTWGLGLAGTYLLSYETKFSPSADKAALLNTVHNPIRLRLRGRLTWDVKSVSAALFVNHMGSYDDTRTTPTVPVASWTTLDVTGGYACTTCNGILENTRFTLGVLNLTDRNPPWVANPYNVNYDGANANALGRFFSLQVERKW